MSLGPYHLVQCLASEGGAEVYWAQASYPNGAVHQVALKVLLSALGSDPGVFEHLARAMEPALACRHEAIVRTLELRTIDRVMVVAMELVDGVDLGSLLASLTGQGHKLSLGLALHLAHSLLEGLDHFHTLRDRHGRAMPVVHGNLHPGNVLLAGSGQVKIADFVISLAVDAAPGAERGGRASLYRSPEQATGDAVDHRTDIFSVGLLLYEALAGRPAYDADELEDPGELEDVICEADILPLEEQVSGLPRDLDRVIHQALEPDPSRRYLNAREMLAALEPFFRLPELATARGALAELVTRVKPRVSAARQVALAARALAAEQDRAHSSEGHPSVVPGLPPPVALPPELRAPVPAVTPSRLDLPLPLDAPRAPTPATERGAAGQQQKWDTAILPPQPDQPPTDAGSAELATSDRQTVVMAAAVARGERDGTDILGHTGLMQLLQQKDQQRTAAGQQQVRECTLFWSCDEDSFVVEPESQTQLFCWSPDEGRAEVVLTPEQVTSPTDIGKQTETRPPRRVSRLKVAALLGLASLVGLGAGAGASFLRGPFPDTGERTLPARAAAPLQVGPWNLRLAAQAARPQKSGALKISVHLTPPPGQRMEAGRFFALRPGGTVAGTLQRPDFWTIKPAGDRSVELALVFGNVGPAPLLLRFAPRGIAPVNLRLEVPNAEKRR